MGVVEAGPLLQGASQLHHLVVIEIKPSHGVTRLWFTRFFYQAECPASVIELDHAITFRILNRIGENACPASLLRSLAQAFHQVVPIEDVVSKHQGAAARTDKFLPYEKCLRDSFRFGLHGILQGNSITPAISE